MLPASTLPATESTTRSTPRPPVDDPLADLADRPGALVTDDVGLRRHLAAGAVEGVAAFDADGFDVDHHAAGEPLGVGHVLVAEDVGRTGLVIDGGLHERTSGR